MIYSFGVYNIRTRCDSYLIATTINLAIAIAREQRTHTK